MIVRYFISLFTILLLFANTVSAATITNEDGKRIGIVIIGDAEFKTQSYFDNAKKLVKIKNYCKDDSYNTFHETESSLFDFLTQNNFDNIICLVIRRPTLESEGWKLKLTVAQMKIETNIYNKNELIKTINTEKKGVSVLTLEEAYTMSTEYNLNEYEIDELTRKAAKKDAFSSCIRQIRKEIKGLF